MPARHSGLVGLSFEAVAFAYAAAFLRAKARAVSPRKIHLETRRAYFAMLGDLRLLSRSSTCPAAKSAAPASRNRLRSIYRNPTSLAIPSPSIPKLLVYKIERNVTGEKSGKILNFSFGLQFYDLAEQFKANPVTSDIRRPSVIPARIMGLFPFIYGHTKSKGRSYIDDPIEQNLVCITEAHAPDPMASFRPMAADVPLSVNKGREVSDVFFARAEHGVSLCRQ